ncbi:MAG TPA: glycoside hydrolase family 15 protein [Candidatus Dormibacteraeota bacterium]|nr:glycoside hydrolase family 15 protein [Candidatus Dormibacteraeota bacterium]
MSTRIEDYALIGDCETAALVSHQGSIDWLCWPNFASPACFAALLGTEENGHWSIAPKAASQSSRRYIDHTLVLETSFKTREGHVVLVDFMPLRKGNSSLVRIVRCVQGHVTMAMQLALRFDYGRSVPWVTRMQEGDMRAIAGPDMVMLHTTAPLRGESMKTVSEFTVREGESVAFVMTYGPSYDPPAKPVDPERSLRETVSFWKKWAERLRPEEEYADAVERSLITLKALTYRPTGGIVAAPTTSLPEQIGGPRNWDYRYCWLRDATFTLLALMNAGYFDEACAWRDWLLRAAAGSPDQVQIMYGICGERNLMEWEVDWLCGYEGSKPVRIGNAASKQLQLDVYGEVADALLHAHLGGIPTNPSDLALQQALTDHLAKIWQQPDDGIWEVRGGQKQFTYSKIMAWVAFDRAIQNAEKNGLKGEVHRWRAVREKIHQEVCQQGFNPEVGSFTEYYGSKELDASLLLIPMVGFLPPHDPRVRGTIEAIEKHLMPDGFVLRYRTQKSQDGLPAGEGAFLACSFWMVSALKMLGRTEDAKRLFDRLLSVRNDVGLLAEEYDPKAKRQLGNFPQALSHISVVNAAYEFTSDSSPMRQRAESKPGAKRPHHKDPE